MPTIYQTIDHKSGIPLGGIGTGSVEIRPDGLFHDWEILNIGAWNPNAPCDDAAHSGSKTEAMQPDDLLFVLRTRTSDGGVLVRYLALRERLHNLYSLAWARSVQSITFEGTFPLARLVYHDPELPVEVRAEVFSPFIPLDSRSSGTPGFFVRFTAKSLVPTPVEVSFLGTMKNAAGFGQESRKPRNRLESIGDAKAVFLSADGLRPGHCTTGDMTFAAAGGELSYITGCYDMDRNAQSMWGAKHGPKPVSILHQFHDKGTLPNLRPLAPPKVPEGLKLEGLSEADRKKLLRDSLQHAFAYDAYRKMKIADPAYADSTEFLGEIVHYLREGRKAEWGWAALCSKMALAPESEGEALFAVGWYFPNHISPTGENIGHAYQLWFGDSLGVTKFLVEDYANLRARTLALPEAIHGSDLPAEAADAITGQLSTLTKCTWWTKAGHFGVWEGLGCCGFHTTDITYQGSFPIISLFPDLQKTQMERGAKFQREDGRVHHLFRPDFGAVDNGFDRVDMNQQFVMLAARDYLWSGDKGYLERLWPHLVRAMDNTAQLDTDGDGLPDFETRRNTYDCWDFTGCPSYISSLWLGALKAAIRLANEVGDPGRAAKWQADYDKGLKSFESKLWNGEYYVLWRDGDVIDECCMSDQMSGDWFGAVAGWEPILDLKRIKKALQSIVRVNFRESEGLINASYPPGKKHRPAASGNMQAEAPWTGIEYTVAALLIHNGMVAEGMDVIRDIHKRYLQAGRFWNHVECGDHYYRAMSSWTVLPALSGFKWDQPTGALAFAPATSQQVCEYPFFTPLGWGSCYQEKGLTGKIAAVQLEDGEMMIWTLSLPKLTGFHDVSVFLGESQVDCEIDTSNGVVVKFKSPITLTPDAPLVITSDTA